MMLSFNTTALKCFLVFMLSFGINGEEVQPYALGFYNANTSSPSLTCMAEFEQVRNYVYPTYYVEVVTDSTITTDIIETISDMGNGAHRGLLRSSTTKGQKDVDERKLQNWCYGLCATQPAHWLVTVGCRTECGLRRRLDDGLTVSHESGNRTNIMSGPGDSTASQFFATVRVVIPITNPCRQVMLDMTYEIIPLVINL